MRNIERNVPALRMSSVAFGRLPDIRAGIGPQFQDVGKSIISRC